MHKIQPIDRGEFQYTWAWNNDVSFFSQVPFEMHTASWSAAVKILVKCVHKESLLKEQNTNAYANAGVKLHIYPLKLLDHQFPENGTSWDVSHWNVLWCHQNMWWCHGNIHGSADQQEQVPSLVSSASFCFKWMFSASFVLPSYSLFIFAYLSIRSSSKNLKKENRCG